MQSSFATLCNRKSALFGALGISLALALLFLFNPADNGWYPHCVFHELTGWHCPGCGTLRAGYQLLHGNIREALSLNLLAVVFLPAYALTYLYRGIRKSEWYLFDDMFRSPVAGWTVAILVSLFWILRNINITPFSWLAP